MASQALRRALSLLSGAETYLATLRRRITMLSGFVDEGWDNRLRHAQYKNGYANISNNSSSLTASGFVISGTNGVYVGDKVTDYLGKLPDGNFATEWPYTINNTQQSRVDISYEGLNLPPPTVAGDIVVTNDISTLPPTGIATSAATDAGSKFWISGAPIGTELRPYPAIGKSSISCKAASIT